MAFDVIGPNLSSSCIITVSKGQFVLYKLNTNKIQFRTFFYIKCLQ